MKKIALSLITLVAILSCKKDKFNEIIVTKTQVNSITDTTTGKITRFIDDVTFRSNLAPTVGIQGGDSLKVDNKLDTLANNTYIYHSHRLPGTKNYIIILKNDEYTLDFKMLWDGLN